MNKNRIIFLLTFLVGLVIVAFHDMIFSPTAILDISGLTLGVLISLFGGAGFLIDLYKSSIL